MYTEQWAALDNADVVTSGEYFSLFKESVSLSLIDVLHDSQITDILSISCFPPFEIGKLCCIVGILNL